LAVDEILAHVKQDTQSGPWDLHYLKDHLSETARLAGEFAGSFGLKKLAQIIAYAHDAGKASPEFQARIAGVSGYDPEAHLEGKGNIVVDHSTAGAQLLVKRLGLSAGLVLAYSVAGHHGGLPNGKDEHDSSLSRRLNKKIPDFSAIEPYLLDHIHRVHPQDFIPGDDKTRKISCFSMHFMIRMLFSTLTDADFLNTEKFMSPEESSVRNNAIPLSALLTSLELYRQRLDQKEQSEINKKRRQIQRWCLDAAAGPPGLYSLTVPTGGGKTVSSLAFALEHARRHGLKRVIYVIPYTSIITQNAGIFRDIFGDGAVTEHHSNMEPDRETTFNRLSSQNWDSPIIVTTNVQFFESFYSNRSSECRKLHNVAKSVLIFDEAQMLPPSLLNPCLQVIRELTDHYGCSAVLCTATQPTLNQSPVLKQGLSGIHEIIPEPQSLYRSFQRVRVEQLEVRVSQEQLSEYLAQHEQVLAIVNTRKDARLIWESLAEKTDIAHCYHLSTMMCPAHRNETLVNIRDRLKLGLPCRVVSTQLVEAGVDIDFPVVYRAIAGIDSIAQAAGRCNREGRRACGTVYVFRGESLPPAGHLRQSAESGERILDRYKADPLGLDAVMAYFHDFFWKQEKVHQMDRKGILDLCARRYDAIPFRQIAHEFSLIDAVTRNVIVAYGKEGKILATELYKCQGFVTRELRKRTQRFIVPLRERVFIELLKNGVLEDLLGDGQYIMLISNDLYDKHVGLKTENPVFLETESLIL